MDVCKKEIVFDCDFYSDDAILKACYDLGSLATFDIYRRGKEVFITLSLQGDDKQLVEMCNDFKKTVIDYQLRQKINEQTKSIKELLIRAALREADIN